MPLISNNDDGLVAELKSQGGEKMMATMEIPTNLPPSINLFEIDQKFSMMRLEPQSVSEVAEIRVAVIGNVDAGKSTLLGVLTRGVLDDGRGKARADLFRHKHELDSGRTSSIGQEILGFSANGSAIRTTYARERRDMIPWERSRSAKVISFMDLAGHERYLKTTMFGLTGGAPDYALLMVGANAGMIGMAKEHLTLAFGLGIPVIIIVSKTDMCPVEVKEETLRQIAKHLRSLQRVPLHIKSLSDISFTVQQLSSHSSQPYHSQKITPIFQLSNVNGKGVELVEKMLNCLPVQLNQYTSNAPSEFYITDTYSVPGVGTVVAGTMISGQVSMGQTLYLGPDTTGGFTPVVVKGVQRKRVNVPAVCAGQCASFALKRIKRSCIRRGMVLISQPSEQPIGKTVREFSAQVIILFHSTTISARYQAMLHCGVIRQSVGIVSIPESVLRTGDRAVIRFRFARYPEYLRLGQRLLFREGRTKGVGRIVELHDNVSL